MTPEQAEQLCIDVVKRLAQWPSLKAALQSGGLEVKAAGIIAAALTTLADVQETILLREYEHVDFVFALPQSVGSARLQIDDVIEVKFNYAKQLGEIVARLPSAIDQANRYRVACDAPNAHVVYFLAAPACEVLPPHPRNSGWGYWNYEMQPAIDTLTASAHEAGAPILGHHSCREPLPLYCAVFQWA